MKHIKCIIFLLHVELCLASQTSDNSETESQKNQNLRPRIVVSDSTVFETYVGQAMLGETWKDFIENQNLRTHQKMKKVQIKLRIVIKSCLHVKHVCLMSSLLPIF